MIEPKPSAVELTPEQQERFKQLEQETASKQAESELAAQNSDLDSTDLALGEATVARREAERDALEAARRAVAEARADRDLTSGLLADAAKPRPERPIQSRPRAKTDLAVETDLLDLKRRAAENNSQQRAA